MTPVGSVQDGHRGAMPRWPSRFPVAVVTSGDRSRAPLTARACGEPRDDRAIAAKKPRTASPIAQRARSNRRPSPPRARVMRTKLADYCQQFTQQLLPLQEPLDRARLALEGSNHGTPGRELLPALAAAQHDLRAL